MDAKADDSFSLKRKLQQIDQYHMELRFMWMNTHGAVAANMIGHLAMRDKGPDNCLIHEMATEAADKSVIAFGKKFPPPECAYEDAPRDIDRESDRLDVICDGDFRIKEINVG
jgi:hypothetical protein